MSGPICVTNGVADGENNGRNVLAIDIGSSSVRVAVAHASGALIATERCAPVMRQDVDAGDLAIEFEPGSIWDCIAGAARDVISDSKLGPDSIAAIAVTSQRQGIALLDGDGKTLYAGPNRDMRAVFQGAAIDEKFADLIWKATGHLPSFLTAWARIKWFQEERPELFGRISSVVTLSDWIVHRLTGELTINRAAGVEAGLLRVADGQPADEISSAIGLDKISVPAPIDSLSIAGDLRTESGQALGLPNPIPVVNAGPDTQAGLYGMGVTSSGATGVVAGWSCAVQRVTDAPTLDPERGLWAGRHVEPDRWVLESNLGIMGGAYSWLCGLIAPGEDPADAMNRLNHLALAAPAGGNGLTVHLGPALTNMSRAGMRTGGLVFPVPLALHAPGPGEIARAALESFGFAIKSGLDRIDELAETPTGTIAVGGGMTRSSAFSELLASILGREINVGGADATLSGAALLAIRALDGQESEATPPTTSFSPDTSLSGDYKYLYEEWLERGRTLGETPD